MGVSIAVTPKIVSSTLTLVVSRRRSIVAATKLDLSKMTFYAKLDTATTPVAVSTSFDTC